MSSDSPEAEGSAPNGTASELQDVPPKKRKAAKIFIRIHCENPLFLRAGVFDSVGSSSSSSGSSSGNACSSSAATTNDNLSNELSTSSNLKSQLAELGLASGDIFPTVREFRISVKTKLSKVLKLWCDYANKDVELFLERENQEYTECRKVLSAEAHGSGAHGYAESAGAKSAHDSKSDSDATKKAELCLRRRQFLREYGVGFGGRGNGSQSVPVVENGSGGIAGMPLNLQTLGFFFWTSPEMVNDKANITGDPSSTASNSATEEQSHLRRTTPPNSQVKQEQGVVSDGNENRNEDRNEGSKTSNPENARDVANTSSQSGAGGLPRLLPHNDDFRPTLRRINPAEDSGDSLGWNHVVFTAAGGGSPATGSTTLTGNHDTNTSSGTKEILIFACPLFVDVNYSSPDVKLMRQLSGQWESLVSRSEPIRQQISDKLLAGLNLRKLEGKTGTGSGENSDTNQNVRVSGGAAGSKAMQEEDDDDTMLVEPVEGAADDDPSNESYRRNSDTNFDKVLRCAITELVAPYATIRTLLSDSGMADTYHNSSGRSPQLGSSDLVACGASSALPELSDSQIAAALRQSSDNNSESTLSSGQTTTQPAAGKNVVTTASSMSGTLSGMLEKLRHGSDEKTIENVIANLLGSPNSAENCTNSMEAEAGATSSFNDNLKPAQTDPKKVRPSSAWTLLSRANALASAGLRPAQLKQLIACRTRLHCGAPAQLLLNGHLKEVDAVLRDDVRMAAIFDGNEISVAQPAGSRAIVVPGASSPLLVRNSIVSNFGSQDQWARGSATLINPVSDILVSASVEALRQNWEHVTGLTREMWDFFWRGGPLNPAVPGVDGAEDGGEVSSSEWRPLDDYLHVGTGPSPTIQSALARVKHQSGAKDNASSDNTGLPFTEDIGVNSTSEPLSSQTATIEVEARAKKVVLCVERRAIDEESGDSLFDGDDDDGEATDGKRSSSNPAGQSNPVKEEPGVESGLATSDASTTTNKPEHITFRAPLHYLLSSVKSQWTKLNRNSSNGDRNGNNPNQQLHLFVSLREMWARVVRAVFMALVRQRACRRLEEVVESGVSIMGSDVPLSGSSLKRGENVGASVKSEPGTGSANPNQVGEAKSSTDATNENAADIKSPAPTVAALVKEVLGDRDSDLGDDGKRADVATSLSSTENDVVGMSWHRILCDMGILRTEPESNEAEGNEPDSNATTTTKSHASLNRASRTSLTFLRFCQGNAKILRRCFCDFRPILNRWTKLVHSNIDAAAKLSSKNISGLETTHGTSTIDRLPLQNLILDESDPVSVKSTAVKDAMVAAASFVQAKLVNSGLLDRRKLVGGSRKILQTVAGGNLNIGASATSSASGSATTAASVVGFPETELNRSRLFGCVFRELFGEASEETKPEGEKDHNGSSISLTSSNAPPSGNTPSDSPAVAPLTTPPDTTASPKLPFYNYPLHLTIRLASDPGFKLLLFDYTRIENSTLYSEVFSRGISTDAKSKAATSVSNSRNGNSETNQAPPLVLKLDRFGQVDTVFEYWFASTKCPKKTRPQVRFVWDRRKKGESQAADLENKGNANTNREGRLSTNSNSEIDAPVGDHDVRRMKSRLPPRFLELDRGYVPFAFGCRSTESFFVFDSTRPELLPFGIRRELEESAMLECQQAGRQPESDLQLAGRASGSSTSCATYITKAVHLEQQRILLEAVLCERSGKPRKGGERGGRSGAPGGTARSRNRTAYQEDSDYESDYSSDGPLSRNTGRTIAAKRRKVAGDTSNHLSVGSEPGDSNYSAGARQSGAHRDLDSEDSRGDQAHRSNARSTYIGLSRMLPDSDAASDSSEGGIGARLAKRRKRARRLVMEDEEEADEFQHRDDTGMTQGPPIEEQPEAQEGQDVDASKIPLLGGGSMGGQFGGQMQQDSLGTKHTLETRSGGTEVGNMGGNNDYVGGASMMDVADDLDKNLDPFNDDDDHSNAKGKRLSNVHSRDSHNRQGSSTRSSFQRIQSSNQGVQGSQQGFPSVSSNPAPKPRKSTRVSKSAAAKSAPRQQYRVRMQDVGTGGGELTNVEEGDPRLQNVQVLSEKEALELAMALSLSEAQGQGGAGDEESEREDQGGRAGSLPSSAEAQSPRQELANNDGIFDEGEAYGGGDTSSFGVPSPSFGGAPSSSSFGSAPSSSSTPWNPTGVSVAFAPSGLQPHSSTPSALEISSAGSFGNTASESLASSSEVVNLGSGEGVNRHSFDPASSDLGVGNVGENLQGADDVDAELERLLQEEDAEMGHNVEENRDT